MRALLAVVIAAAAVAVVASSACLPLHSQGGDGATCGSDDDCTTANCYGGYCVGGSCGPSSGCATGFACVYDDGGILNIGAGYYCAMACGFDPSGSDGCPPAWSCDATDECYYAGPQLTVSVSPAMPASGQPITFTASASPAADSIDSVMWTFTTNDGSAVGSATGATVTETFAGGYYTYYVSAVIDDKYESTNDEVSVCFGAGDLCDNDCCPGLACTYGSDGTTTCQ